MRLILTLLTLCALASGALAGPCALPRGVPVVRTMPLPFEVLKATLSRDDTLLALAGDGQAALISLDDLSVTQVSTERGAPTYIAFSPDGGELWVIDKAGGFARYDAMSGAALPTPPFWTVSRPGFSLTASSFDSVLAQAGGASEILPGRIVSGPGGVVAANGAVYVYDKREWLSRISANGIERVARLPLAERGMAVLNPHGTHVLATDGQAVHVLDLNGNAPMLRTYQSAVNMDDAEAAWSCDGTRLAVIDAGTLTVVGPETEQQQDLGPADTARLSPAGRWLLRTQGDTHTLIDLHAEPSPTLRQGDPLTLRTDAFTRYALDLTAHELVIFETGHIVPLPAQDTDPEDIALLGAFMQIGELVYAVSSVKPLVLTHTSAAPPLTTGANSMALSDSETLTILTVEPPQTE